MYYVNPSHPPQRHPTSTSASFNYRRIGKLTILYSSISQSHNRKHSFARTHIAHPIIPVPCIPEARKTDTDRNEHSFVARHNNKYVAIYLIINILCARIWSHNTTCNYCHLRPQYNSIVIDDANLPGQFPQQSTALRLPRGEHTAINGPKRSMGYDIP